MWDELPENPHQVLCAVIRLAPVIVCVGAHVSTRVLVPPCGVSPDRGGLWWAVPSDRYCEFRAAEYGFSIPGFKREATAPVSGFGAAVLMWMQAVSDALKGEAAASAAGPWHWRYSLLFTHMLVHVSNLHLLSNIPFMSTVALEFGTDSDSDRESDHVVAGGDEEDEGTPPPPLPQRLSWFMGRMHRACRTIVGHLQEEHASRAMCQTARLMVIMQMTSVVGGIGAQFLLYRGSQAAAAESGLWMMHAHTVVCGASAAVFGASGFNLGCYARPFTSAYLLTGEVLSIVFRSGVSEDGSMRVGHVGHLGGYAAGLGLGTAVRLWKRLRSRRGEQRERAPH